jgi:hypothetical protein
MEKSIEAAEKAKSNMRQISFTKFSSSSSRKVNVSDPGKRNSL